MRMGTIVQTLIFLITVGLLAGKGQPTQKGKNNAASKKPTTETSTTERSTTETSTSETTTTETTTSEATTTETAGSETGGIVGGVVAAVVVIGAVVALVFWFKYKRNKTPRVETGKQDDSHFEVPSVSKKAKNKEVNTNSRSNFDYTTINDDIEIRHEGTDNYVLARTPVRNRITQNGEARKIEEDDYNHLDDQEHITINGDKPSGYDTTASAAAAVRKLQNKSSSNREGDYDYNHLSDNSDVKPTRSDYDTAASAARAVAQMVKDKDTTEDDHFHKTEIKSSNLTEECVNTTDYSLAGTMDKNDPYDLAK